MDDAPQSKAQMVVRDERGRLVSGTTAINPGGRPKVLKEYKAWLEEMALDKAKAALLDCLDSEDGKVRMMAVKEVADRLFGKAPQAITDADGKPIGMGILILPVEK